MANETTTSMMMILLGAAPARKMGVRGSQRRMAIVMMVTDLWSKHAVCLYRRVQFAGGHYFLSFYKVTIVLLLIFIYL